MYVEHNDAYEFMFSVNKQTRSFIQTNLIKVRNGYINGGLIEYELKFEP